ncbi:MAG: hypothetical protein Q4C91_15475 [Eubacteriales bacterium]|nr:hypothetical protein [Eubacteriales bacterium]
MKKIAIFLLVGSLCLSSGASVSASEFTDISEEFTDESVNDEIFSDTETFTEEADTIENQLGYENPYDIPWHKYDFKDNYIWYKYREKENSYEAILYIPDALDCEDYNYENDKIRNVLIKDYVYIDGKKIPVTRFSSDVYDYNYHDGEILTYSRARSVIIPSTVTVLSSPSEGQILPDAPTAEHALTDAPWLTKIDIQGGRTPLVIEKKALSNYPKLKKVHIPSRVTFIGEGALSGCDDPIIYGERGTAAERYAKQNGFAFEVLADEQSVLSDVDELKRPEISSDESNGKKLRISLDEKIPGADGYIYELVKEIDDDGSLTSTVKKETSNTYADFTVNQNGTYRFIVTAWKYGENGQKIYSDVSNIYYAWINTAGPRYMQVEKLNNCNAKFSVEAVEGAQGYDFVLGSYDCLTTKKFRSVHKNCKTPSTIFSKLEQHGGSVYCRAWHKDANGKKVYTGWSEAGEFRTESPYTPSIKSIQAKGKTITVKTNKLNFIKDPNAKVGYNVTLSEWPSGYGASYVKKNQTSSTITMKNIQPGTYYCRLHAYIRGNGSDKSKQFSAWSEVKKVVVK